MSAPHVAGILLLTSVKTDGFACIDPDGEPDPIAHKRWWSCKTSLRKRRLWWTAAASFILFLP